MDKSTITIPRLEKESMPAYQARVRYIVLGEARSQEKVSKELGKSLDLIGRWSARDHWVEHAQRYDETLATLAAQAHAEEYQQELEDHRKRYQKAGKDLYTVAAALIGVCAQALRGKTIKGADGQTYTIPAMEITPNTLAIAARALTTAGDLEAHALRIADILPGLERHDRE